MSKTEWEEIGYVVSSQYRTDVLEILAENPSTPSQLADDTGKPISHVSRALSNLKDRGIVELLVPESRQKGRYYGATEKGEEIWDTIEKRGAENL